MVGVCLKTEFRTRQATEGKVFFRYWVIAGLTRSGRSGGRKAL